MCFNCRDLYKQESWAIRKDYAKIAQLAVVTPRIGQAGVGKCLMSSGPSGSCEKLIVSWTPGLRRSECYDQRPYTLTDHLERAGKVSCRLLP